MKYPPYLTPGATIAIVCPAGFMPAEKATSCIRTLKRWGYKTIKGKTLGGRSKTYFSGTDEERLADLQCFLDDPNVDAILFGRGGYGTTRLLESIDWRGFRQKPKWLIGFSDITVLHGFVQSKLKTASIHGPMTGAFNHDEGINRFTLSLKDSLEGKPVHYRSASTHYDCSGKAKAPVIGGNLCLLAHAIGGMADMDTKGNILFIEDVGEQLYNIDRMMIQLKRAGKLKGLKGLIVGSFSDGKDTDRPYGKTAYQIIDEHVREFRYPKCYGFPIGHEKENVAIILGKTYRFEVNENGATLDG